ncbi:MAG: response regulator [Sulfuritalea sp.]|nr:response regulator [Sulfuritalea sp.]
MSAATIQLASRTLAPPPSPEKRPTLLFVDDEERILRTLKLMFASQYRVLVTTSGHEALQMLRRETVHVLISDQRMPIMAGVDLLRQAKDIAPNTMRLLLTGYSDIEAIIDSINDGEVFRYINKPWEANEVRKIVGEAAEIAMSLESRPPLPGMAMAVGETRTILLIDHSPEIATSLGNLLKEDFPGEFRLVYASRLEEAISLLEKYEISVIVSELHVGNEDVTPFLKTLKHFHPQIVTIVLTSFQDTLALTNLINQGQIHRFIPKPVRRGMTSRSIRSGIERHNEIRMRPLLVNRHRVEAPIAEIQHGLFNRVRGMIQRLGATGQK